MSENSNENTNVSNILGSKSQNKSSADSLQKSKSKDKNLPPDGCISYFFIDYKTHDVLYA